MPEWGDSPSGWLVVVGDGVVRVQMIESDGGETGDGDGDGHGDGVWVTPPEPDGGWGELRAVFGNLEQVWAVGAGGVAWHSTDPTGVWTAEDIGLGEVDLNDGGPHRTWADWTYDDFMVVGDAGSVAFFQGVRWRLISTNIDADLVGYANGLVLDRDGRLFQFRVEDYRLHRRTGKVEGLNRGMCKTSNRHHPDAAAPEVNDVVVFGVDGRLRQFEEDRELCYL
jgi:hypothetical protein